MLTPTKFDDIVNQSELIKIYGRLNGQLAHDIAQQLRKGQFNTVTESQIKVLMRQGGKEAFRKALKRLGLLNRIQQKEINRIFSEVYEEEVKGYVSQYERVDKNFKISSEQKQILDSAIRQTKGKLKNFTKSVAFATQSKYISLVDHLFKKVASGSYDYNTAIKDTLKSLYAEGIEVVESSSGRKYNIENMVRQNLFTSLKKTANDISYQVGQEIGANCVRIYGTPTCRPSHYPINDVLMGLKEFENYQYLTEEYNCNHIVNYLWREEFENPKQKTIRYDSRTLSEVTKLYQNTQKQRYYERQVREKKKELVKMRQDGQAKTEDYNKTLLKLANAQRRTKTFVDYNGLRRDYQREYVAGYNEAYKYKKPSYRDTVLSKSLQYTTSGGTLTFIPKSSIITDVKVIAGKNTTEFRNAEKYAKKYGGVKEEYFKLAGKIESNERIFDIHFVANNRGQTIDFKIAETHEKEKK